MKNHFNCHYAFLSILAVFFTFCCMGTIFAANDNQSVTQGKTVTGTVTEKETGEMIYGASVSVKGTTTGTVTDGNGKFSIAVGSNADVLVFSYLGKKRLEIVVGTMTTIDVQMEDDAQMLREVVVQTGYMMQKKADLTGSLVMADASDIEKNPRANVMKSLQGKLPGVYITSNGNPAESVGIQIRGMTSIQRGVDPLIIVDGQPVNINFRDINTLDIETIQILKDAASASIYGSRAASGVILIETKKAKTGDLSVKYDGSFGISKLIHKPKMLNTEQYGRAIWQATVNDGDDPNSIRIYNYDWSRGANKIATLNSVRPVEWLNAAQTMRSADTDWWDEMTQIGMTNNHQVTVSGGTPKSRSLFSMNYYDNQGTVIESYFQRITARMNSDYDLVKDRLKIGESFTVSYLSFNGREDNYNAVVIPSIVPVYTTDGGWGGSAMGMGMDDLGNPVRALRLNSDNPDYFQKLMGTTYLELSILKNLKFKTQYGVDFSYYYRRHTNHKWVEGGGKLNNENGVTNYQYTNLSWTWTNTLLYNLFSGKHSLDVLIGQEAYHFVNEGFESYRSGLHIEDKDFAFISATNGTRVAQYGWGDEQALLSYFAKANYVFDQKYLFSATFRRDGSSKFGANNRYGTFPAFSAGWRIKNESFLEEKTWLSDLKLRFSWGMNGNSNIPSTALINTYFPGYNDTAYSIGGSDSGTLGMLSGIYKTHTGNANMKWEATTQTNFGFDFGFLNQHWNGSFDYFIKKTNDMLFEPNYIGSLGEGGYQWINAADMQNTGWEFLFMYNNDTKSDFQYSITANFSAFVNKITSLPETVQYQYGGNATLDYIVGRPLNSIYGYVAEGLFQTQEEVDNSPQKGGKGLGRIRYKDLDGDGRITPEHDRTWIGCSDPDLMAGLNFDARYKNFDINVFFQGVFGRQVYNEWKIYSDFWNVTVQNDKNHPVRIMDAWSLNNQNSTIPALSRRNANNEIQNSTYIYDNASFVKLRTVELGYTLPKQIAAKMYLQRLRLYCSGSNLMTLKKTWGDDAWTGPDPENTGFAYRIPMDFTFGINATF